MPDPTAELANAKAERETNVKARRLITQVALATIRANDKRKGELLYERSRDLLDIFGDFTLDPNLFIPVVNGLMEASKGTDGRPVFEDLKALAMAHVVFSEGVQDENHEPETPARNKNGGSPRRADPIGDGDDGEDLQERPRLSS